MSFAVPFVDTALLPVQHASSVGVQLRGKSLKERKSKSKAKSSVLFTHPPPFYVQNQTLTLPAREASCLNTKNCRPLSLELTPQWAIVTIIRMIWREGGRITIKELAQLVELI